MKLGRARGRVKDERGSASGYKCVCCAGRARQWTYMGGCEDELWGSPGYSKGRLLRPQPYCLHVEHWYPMCAKCARAYVRTRERGVRP